MPVRRCTTCKMRPVMQTRARPCASTETCRRPSSLCSGCYCVSASAFCGTALRSKKNSADLMPPSPTAGATRSTSIARARPTAKGSAARRRPRGATTSSAQNALAGPQTMVSAGLAAASTSTSNVGEAKSVHCGRRSGDPRRLCVDHDGTRVGTQPCPAGRRVPTPTFGMGGDVDRRSRSGRRPRRRHCGKIGDGPVRSRSALT